MKREKWSDLLNIGEKTLPPHADFQAKPESSVSLNGVWDFACTKGIRDGIENTDCPDTIIVPGCWEGQGYGQPYYFPMGYPSFVHTEEDRIPELEEAEIYTGRYRRRFTLDEAFLAGKRIVLSFGSVKSMFECRINGIYVGMGKGSMLPVEFDVTGAVKAGENEIEVFVTAFSDASYIEDQDMWHLAGIYRDVILTAEPAVRISDAVSRASFDDGFTRASLTTEIAAEGISASGIAEAVVILSDGDTVIARGAAPIIDDAAAVTLDCGQVRLWSAETPALYTVTVLLTVDGETADEKRYSFGFREIKIDGERLLINGMPLKLRGMNYSAFTPEGGYYVPEDVFRRDLTLMKRLNINAVRTSHYPQDECFYRLCDELGIYVMDECNVESHGVREKNVPGDNPLWTPHVVDRMRRMVTRDRNHPCVVIWSLGNESESGENFYRMRKAALALDPTRPIHYEGGADLEASDFVCVGYSSHEREQMFADGLDVPDRNGVVASEMSPDLQMSLNMITFEQYRDHPIVATEYMHSMGNSGCDMGKHTDIYEASDRWCGGFVWDFKDKALTMPGVNGLRKNYGYGGDFGPGDTPGVLGCNGICDPDGRPHEQAWELQKAFQPFTFSRPNDFTLEIFNRNSFLDLAAYELSASAERDGALLCEETLYAACPPRHSVRIKLPEKLVDFPRRPGVYTLLLEVRVPEKTAWCEAGTVVAREQFVLCDIPSAPSAADQAGAWTVSEDRLSAEIQGVRYAVDRASGSLTQIDPGRGSILLSPLRANFWRAVTDADLGFLGIVMQKDRARDAWAKISLGDLVPAVTEELLPDGGARYREEYFDGETRIGRLVKEYRVRHGGVELRAEFTPEVPPRRFGFQAELPRGFDRMNWLGKGPHDTYRGRDDSGVFGRWSKAVEDQDEHMRPQEHGWKSGVREVAFEGASGRLVFHNLGDTSMGCAAWPYTLEELHEARHIDELPAYTKTTVLVDAVQNGLGDSFVKLTERYKMKAGQSYVLHMLISFDKGGTDHEI